MPAAAPEGPPDRHRRRCSDGREGTNRTMLTARRRKGSEHPITCISNDEQESDVAAQLGLDLQKLDLDDLDDAPDLDLDLLASNGPADVNTNMDPTPSASNHRRKMRGALDALNRQVSAAAKDGEEGLALFSSAGARKVGPKNGNHVPSSPNRISSKPAQSSTHHSAMLEYTYDYAPPSEYNGQGQESILYPKPGIQRHCTYP